MLAVARSGAAALMFAGEGTPLAAAGARRAPAGTSPLLILTNDRQYSIASAAGVDAADVSAEPIAGGLPAACLPLMPIKYNWDIVCMVEKGASPAALQEVKVV